MTRLPLAFLLCLGLSDAAAQTLVERAKNDEVIRIESDDPAMNKAVQRAQASLDGFLQDALAPAPRNTSHAVKVKITDRNDNTEFFWVAGLRRDGAGFQGELNNEPRLVKHLRLGQTISFKRSDIADWLYVDPIGRMHGNYTTCVLLKREKPEEAQALATQLRLRCD